MLLLHLPPRILGRRRLIQLLDRHRAQRRSSHCSSQELLSVRMSVMVMQVERARILGRRQPVQPVDRRRAQRQHLHYSVRLSAWLYGVKPIVRSRTAIPSAAGTVSRTDALPRVAGATDETISGATVPIAPLGDQGRSAAQAKGKDRQYGVCLWCQGRAPPHPSLPHSAKRPEEKNAVKYVFYQKLSSPKFKSSKF